MKKLLKFKAVWCGPCKSLSNIMEGVDLGIPVVEIDVDDDMETAIRYNIRNVPTLVLVENGIEVKRTTGVSTLQQLQSWIND